MPRALRVVLSTLVLFVVFGWVLQVVAHLLFGGLFGGEWFLVLLPAGPDFLDWIGPLCLFGLALLQSCLLFGAVPVANVAAAPAAPLLPRVIGGALLCSMPLILLGFAAIDLVFFQPAAVREAYDPRLWMAGLIVAWVVSWGIWIPVLLHRSKSAPDGLERAVGKGIVGSAVALALTLPWYLVVRTKERCYCSLGSYCALVLGVFALLVVGGPLLLVFARDRRIRAALRSE